MKKLRFISLLLALLALSQSLACSTVEEGKETTKDSNPTLELSEDYSFSTEYSGNELHILNTYDIYSMHSQLDRDTITGETLDDAMYNRCRRVEDRMGIKLIEDNTYKVGTEMTEAAQRLILANDDTYDIMYISTNGINSLVKIDGLTDLYGLENISLDADWWQTDFNDKLVQNGSLYSAASSAHLMYIDSLWCVFFNEDMMTDRKLELPYQLVRDGKWTLDKMLSYQKSGADLNGDDSFEWRDDGKSVYGFSGAMVIKFLSGCGEMILEKDDSGEVIFTAGSERFYSACEKIAAVLVEDGGIRFAGKSGLSDGDIGNYITTFETERALMVHAEVCKTQRFRSLDFTYGILPNPKLDETQDRYYSSPFDGCPLMTIPVTARDAEFSAAAIDALSYVSYYDVLPTYTEITLESKGLRNDESIEMLGIILDASCPDLTYYYSGIVDSFSNQLQNAIKTNSGNYASVIAANSTAISEALESINK